ncbi:MAG: F0F1 ATP synthase subunit A [Defluviitaleaceae bacterium]|nr:F0F1 ATP synthase subunit A [Defluviitaleaceae bacterium]
MDFNIAIVRVFEVFGIPIWITETLINTWIVMAVLIILAIVVRLKLTYTDSPKGIQNVAEAIIETFDRFVRNTAGDKLAYLGNWFFAVFFFVLFSNFSGLFLRPPTADWAVTFAMALATFVLIQVMGIKYRPKAYFKSFIEPFPVFLPLNLIGELARPISLSFRLFGNILAGMILMGLVYGLLPWFAVLGWPAFLHIYFDLAMGLLQTYIFTVLSLAFIGSMAGTSE